jgi:photosystem II stability/assembly factor-like uncharacterized protein
MAGSPQRLQTQSLNAPSNRLFASEQGGAPRVETRMKPYRVNLLVPCLAVLVLLNGHAMGNSQTETTFGLYQSQDRGNSWSKVGQGLPATARINALGMARTTAIAGTDQGIFISRDAGVSWGAAHVELESVPRVLCLAYQSGRAFAGTAKHGLLVSEDEGLTWKARNAGLTDLYIRSVLATGTRLYVGTDRHGVFISEDAGASWVQQSAGLPEASQIFDLAAVGEQLFAALYSKGLYRWEPDRKRWVKAGEVRPLEIEAAGEVLVVGHNPGGVFVSEDLGQRWSEGNSGLPINAPTWTLAADDDRVWIGTSGKVGLVADDIGLFASRDRGKTWARSDTGLPPASAAVSFVVARGFILAGILEKKKNPQP